MAAEVITQQEQTRKRIRMYLRGAAELRCTTEHLPRPKQMVLTADLWDDMIREPGIDTEALRRDVDVVVCE